eukprot:365866-Chlamydomonas_euryale.AAC.4
MGKVGPGGRRRREGGAEAPAQPPTLGQVGAVVRKMKAEGAGRGRDRTGAGMLRVLIWWGFAPKFASAVGRHMFCVAKRCPV